ncbi:hypothetical protein CCAN11_670001 [Capnocytophaga canimorsus]|uniref:Uncharacterized protein n=1 Tax=Capnocytophaga canimorsus TaxID=28188 RepID=A0A0B7ITE5_9FLAO|nr:hypothetical protein CCAN11_670001 [Capnocytophaga canimorsus]
MELTATDNCSEKAQVTNSREERQENGNKVIIYKWEASDECGNKTTHTQKVTVKKSLQPTPPYELIAFPVCIFSNCPIICVLF